MGPGTEFGYFSKNKNNNNKHSKPWSQLCILQGFRLPSSSLSFTFIKITFNSF
ncbi:rCG29381 [Rattus norvegicus]|uniref:RCG29381 n=1 Tax=Rattus norvegicus TaxID=10116 RepID=A6K964_RAT|nr:rCG29381 [Rattus norvegicus]